MAYALSSEKMILDLNPRRRFPVSIQSGVKFYFCARSSLIEQRVLEFKVKQLPVSKVTISHLVSALVCSFLLYMLKTDSYCSFQQNCYGRAKASLVIGGTCHVYSGKSGSLAIPLLTIFHSTRMKGIRSTAAYTAGV